MTAIITNLSTDEVRELATCEEVIERGLKTFYEVGSALLVIRDSRLYRADYGTFEDYCQGRWGMTHRNANYLIASADVIADLGNMFPVLPSSGRQAWALARLTTPEARQEVWGQALADTRQGEQPTGAAVAAAVERYQERTGKDPFYCPDCSDVFPEEVWHCPVCDHHWQMHREECWNCHSFSRTDPAPGNLDVHFSSATPEHYTPEHIIATVVSFFDSIDLDPCAEEGDTKTVPARVHFTASDDGLSRPWFGRVYMNPPYGRAIGPWVEKLADAYESREIEAGIALVPARTDTAWFRRLRDFPRCEIRGRLTFVGNDESAPFPSVLVYLGDELDRFARAVADLGDVFVRYETEG